MIEIRKLAAVDMVWLGTRIVLAEYALGVALPLGLGLLSVRVALSHRFGTALGQLALGIWLLGIAANYVPLFVTRSRWRAREPSRKSVALSSLALAATGSSRR